MYINRKLIKGSVITVLTALYCTGCSFLPKEDHALAPPLVTATQEKLATYEVKKGDLIKKIQGAGFFEPTDVKHYQFKSPNGRVISVNVNAGDHVKIGDVLIQLEVEGLEVAVKRKELEVAKATLNLQQANKQEDQLSSRIQRLELEVAQLELQEAQNHLRDSRLIADTDGIVTFVAKVKPGDQVSPYTVLVDTAAGKKFRIQYKAVRAEDISDVKVGMDAEYTVNGKVYQAKVVQAPSAGPIGENLLSDEEFKKTVILEMLQQNADITIGQWTDLAIFLAKRINVLIIPSNAFRSFSERDSVQILDGEIRRDVDVQVGLQTAKEVEITDGLTEGQQVILQ